MAANLFTRSTNPGRARSRHRAREPRQAVNPGEHRRPPIPEWRLGYDPGLNSMTAVPVDPALTPQDAYHKVYGAPFYPAPGWDWKCDTQQRRYYAIAMRPKTPIPKWTQRFDPKLGSMTPVPVDPRLTPEQAYHGEYGTPLSPARGWKWEFNSRTERLVPVIQDEPNRPCEPRFALPKLRRLYRWHPAKGHFSLVREDDDDGNQYEDNLYEYDAERRFFKRYQPLLEPTATKPRHRKIKPKSEPPPRRRFFVRLPDGNYAITRDDSLDDIYEYDAQQNQFVRVAK